MPRARLRSQYAEMSTLSIMSKTTFDFHRIDGTVCRRRCKEMLGRVLKLTLRRCTLLLCVCAIAPAVFSLFVALPPSLGE